MKNMDFICGFSNATVYDKAGMFVNITIVICIAIVILALIAAWTIFRCRKKDAEMKLELESRKRDWEKEDAQRKIDLESQKRDWEKEVEHNKVKAEIRNKKMIFLEEYVKKDSELKDLSKEEAQDYLNMLDNLV